MESVSPVVAVPGPGNEALEEVASLRRQIATLMDEVEGAAGERLSRWESWLERPEFSPAALNLAHYLALRHHDLRPLQRRLAALGLSSLGRLEGRVLPTLRAVSATLAAVSGERDAPRPPADQLFAGETLLAEQTDRVLGKPARRRPVRLLITCPSEAADDPAFMRNLVDQGVEAIRINCAHDDAAAWTRMIGHVRAAEAASSHRMKILMDLAGPKIRTGIVRAAPVGDRIAKGATIAITRPGAIAETAVPMDVCAVECSLPEVFDHLSAGQHVFIDDGKIGACVEKVEAWGVLARVSSAPMKGKRIKPELGLNFPDTELHTAAMTEKDRDDIAFVAAHADGVGLSFVQSAADVATVQDLLAIHRPVDWRQLSLVLKIETPRAVRNLPDIVVRAAGRQPTAIMIARGDLAVELGFARMAEMQEEILWIGEAASVPVIWATQVLDSLIRKGTPSRGEMTDAAMSARAECVMLNKGPYLLDAVTVLDTLLRRMEEHQHKKTAQLRRLASW